MKEKTKTFQDLIVWQKAHQLVMSIYSITNDFPKSEVYGLTSQIRRSSVSIPANICEGYRKLSTKDKLRFYNIAQGSLEETRYYLILSKDLKYIEKEEYFNFQNLLEEVSKLLNS